MKAIILEQTGPASNLKMIEIDKPRAKSGEVIVAVKALSVNPVDYKVRAIDPVLTAIYGEKRPAILGWDIAGEVVEVGQNSSKFNVGDFLNRDLYLANLEKVILFPTFVSGNYNSRKRNDVIANHSPCCIPIFITQQKFT